MGTICMVIVSGALEIHRHCIATNVKSLAKCSQLCLDLVKRAELDLHERVLYHDIDTRVLPSFPDGGIG